MDSNHKIMATYRLLIIIFVQKVFLLENKMINFVSFVASHFVGFVNNLPINQIKSSFSLITEL